MQTPNGQHADMLMYFFEKSQGTCSPRDRLLWNKGSTRRTFGGLVARKSTVEVQLERTRDVPAVLGGLWAKRRPRGRTAGRLIDFNVNNTRGPTGCPVPFPCSRSSASHLSDPPALGELLGIVLVQEHGVFLVLHVRPRGFGQVRSSSPHAGPRRWPSPISVKTQSCCTLFLLHA